jgi:transcriptional regulator with XRE-family HTH domain
MTRTSLAHKAEVSVKTIYSILNDEHEPSLPVIARIAEALGEKPEVLTQGAPSWPRNGSEEGPEWNGRQIRPNEGASAELAATMLRLSEAVRILSERMAGVERELQAMREHKKEKKP